MLDHFLVADLTSRGDDRAPRVIMGRAIRQKIVALHALDGVRSPVSGRPNGWSGQKCSIEYLLHMRRWLVAIHQDFLAYDATLTLDVVRREFRIHVEITKDVAQPRKEFRSGNSVITCAFLGRIRVHVAAHAFDLLHNAAGRPAQVPLKSMCSMKCEIPLNLADS